jgi:hypothetical protein
MSSTNKPITDGVNRPRGSWPGWLALMLMWGAFAYTWLVPLFRPRGLYFWGHYQLRDVYVGIPLALVTICASVVMGSPARLHRQMALRMVTLFLTVIVVLFLIDAFYALVFLGAWRSNYYLDLGDMPRRYNAPDKELGFKTIPGLSWQGRKNSDVREVNFRTDENGFRNPRGLRQADIVFIGDSFTEAAEVPEEDTFVQRIARRTGMTAVNLGMGAYGPQQEQIVLERYGLKYNPRVVVWQIFEGNDLGDAQSFVVWKQNPDKAFVSLPGRYLHNSLLNSWLSRTLPNRPEPGTAPATLRYEEGEARKIFVRYPYSPDQPAQKSLGFSETTQAIDAGNRLCNARGIRLLIVFVPSMVRVMAPRLTFDREVDRQRFLPGGLVTDNRDFGTKLAAFCRQINCSYLDLFPLLKHRAGVNARNLYFPTDEHFDLLGHELVAQEVSLWIKGPEPAASQ